MDLASQLSEITQRIVRTTNPDKIILFGSYASGDPGTESDLDLLLIVPEIKHTRQESKRIRRALRGLLVPVDIVIATPEQINRFGNVAGLVYRTALSEGKVLYERSR